VNDERISAERGRGCGLLEDKVFLVAGVGPQMGAATALIAAREGAKVALVARSEEMVGKVAGAIRAAGGSALPLRCDLNVPDDLRAAVDATLAEFGRVDAVFYNAAYYDHKHADLEIDDAVWQKVMNVNLMGPLALARLTIPSMLENGGGSFVFNSSAGAFYAEEVRLGYGVSKAGLNALTRFVASKYGRQGIRANAILPSVVAGDLAPAVSQLAALGRSGTAEEIGEVVVFLCSDRASIITGQVIHLDGGLFIGSPWPSTARNERRSVIPGGPGSKHV
jgi:NAD(P)-dependent dehydrogenase (short-subunit alcohol dehydrogenase family)